MRALRCPQLGVAAALAAILLLAAVTPIVASAYQIDVHYYLTYVLARLAGLDDPQAYLVARADQSQDDNATTTAFRIPLPWHYQAHGQHWHALNASQAAVMQRFVELQCRAGIAEAFERGVQSVCTNPVTLDEPDQLVALGQFLHYYQDTYAHSRKGELTGNWVPYGSLFGHLFEGIQPDLVPNRPALAELMAWESFCALRVFASEHGERRAVYPDRATIDEIVAAIASAYEDDRGNRPPGAAGSTAPAGRTGHYRAANLDEVRCALSAVLERSSTPIDHPGVADIGYQMLVYDEKGVPQPNPPALVPSPDAPIRCADNS